VTFDLMMNTPHPKLGAHEEGPGRRRRRPPHVSHLMRIPGMKEPNTRHHQSSADPGGEHCIRRTLTNKKEVKDKKERKRKRSSQTSFLSKSTSLSRSGP
jgi:hypothetical protein